MHMHCKSNFRKMLYGILRSCLEENMKTVHCLFFLSKSLLWTQNKTNKNFYNKKRRYNYIVIFFLDRNVFANREDLCQSDPQNSPSQSQEHINQGFRNDEFQSGKDS